MHTPHLNEDSWLPGDCGCSQCEAHDGPQYVDEDLYDDPYEVVMYDIDVEDDDLYALIDMLGDSARSWYARRRLNSLAASGPLSALVADIIIDSLGRRWDPLLHPRDRFGRFINTGGFLRWLVSNGEWLRGQVSRIDSDGNIHVRSAGNDSVPDGSIFRFKPELSNKLVSTESPVATLDDVDVDADVDVDVDTEIPDFPEASDIQKRIWNQLADGDIPAEDLDRSLRDLDLSVEDFAGEVTGLEDRGLIEIDRTGDKPRVRRLDDETKAVIDVGDDEIVEVPDDETPDLEDSPALTKSQRDLLDSIVELDSGEGDGVAFVELEDNDDVQSLIDAGAVEEKDGRLFLANPEGDAEAVAEIPEDDISTEIFNASQERIDDPAAQEAFQHYAEELARPGDENNIPLPDDVSPAKRRNAQSLAEAWWENRNAGAAEDVVPEADEVVEDAVPEANAKDALNPRNQALADQLAGDYFGEELDVSGEPYLDTTEGTEYRNALKRLFDAEDLDENGFSDQAAAERDKAERAMRRIGVSEEDIEGWPIEVRNMRAADAEGADVDVPEEVVDDVVPEEALDEPLPDDVVPEEVVPDDVAPEADVVEPEPADVAEEEILPEDVVPEETALDEVPEDVAEPDVVDEVEPDVVDDVQDVDFDNLATWVEWQKRVNDERDLNGDINDELVTEARIASELGLDLFAGDGLVNWNSFIQTVDVDVADNLYRKHDGAVGPAAMDFIMNRNKWDAYSGADAPPTKTARVLNDDERDLLSRIQNGGQAKRSERDLEDALIEEGLLEEDDNGDSRLSDSGTEALGGGSDGGDSEPPQAPPTPDDVPEPDDDSAPTNVDIDQILEEEEAIANANSDAMTDEVADEAVDDTAPAAAPTLPDPADPNSDTDGFERIGGQGGLNAGGFYNVTEDNGPLKAGDQVYIKNGRSPEHAQNELLANRLYGLADVAVPEMYLGDTNDRLVSKVIPDLEAMNIHDPQDQDVVDKVRSEFAIDSWIANWDGMNPGNTLISPERTPYRIDVGSAMEYRAQGGLKGAAFGDTIGELDSLRDPSINYDTGIVFGPMSNDEVKASLDKLAAINPDDIRSTILASDLPDKDALAEKMVARRSNALSAYNIPDPYAPADTTPDGDGDLTGSHVAPAPAPATVQTVKVKSAAAQKRLNDFRNRTNPHLEPQYDDNDVLIMSDGSSLSPTQYYHTAKGGEGKHGLVVEVLDQDRYPGLVKMEFQDGTQQVRHVLGVNSGKGGLVPSSQTDVDEWERQARVVGEKAEDVIDPADFPMSDGNAPVAGSQIVFDVGGDEQYGVILYFNEKYDNGGRAYIIPEGGGKIVARPVRAIRAQTPEELDADATPQVPYEHGKVVPQYLPPPRFDAQGNLLSRENQPIHVGDWLAQRSGGDGLVGEVIDIPDQNLYPGWVTLRFPDGEERARHVEGFTGTNLPRGAGGLKHVEAPDPDTWTRVRRVKGEEGDVLSYDFSNLETSDGTPIQVGQAVFGKGRNGQDVTGLLIRINPHTKRGGDVVPTGFVWQNGREVPVDVSKITNTVPPLAPPPVAPQPRVTRAPSRPSPARTTRTTPGRTRAPTTGLGHSTQPAPSPINNTDNQPAAYTAGSGTPLSDEQIDGLDTNARRLYTSRRTNGVHSGLAAVYEEQNFDVLPQVVSQAEYARLARDEGYVPIVRSVQHGTENTSGLPYADAYKWGAYYAGDGVYGNGSYFAYGDNALSETGGYGNNRIYALVRPQDLRTINIDELIEELREEMNTITQRMSEVERGSDEYVSLKKKHDLWHYKPGEYAASKGYDAIIAQGGNSHWGSGRPNDDDLATHGYIVILNRGSTIVADQAFSDREDIFRRGLPADLADQASPPTPAVPPVDPNAPDVAEAPADDAGLAPGAAPGVV